MIRNKEDNNNELTKDYTSLKIFSPAVTNWLIALIAGLVLPLLAQSKIAYFIQNLSSTPYLVAGKMVIPTPDELSFAPIVLGFISIIFFIIVIYQFRFLAILKTHSSVWALIFTVAAPYLLWFQIPLIIEWINLIKS